MPRLSDRLEGDLRERTCPASKGVRIWHAGPAALAAAAHRRPAETPNPPPPAPAVRPCSTKSPEPPERIETLPPRQQRSSPAWKRGNGQNRRRVRPGPPRSPPPSMRAIAHSDTPAVRAGYGHQTQTPLVQVATATCPPCCHPPRTATLAVWRRTSAWRSAIASALARPARQGRMRERSPVRTIDPLAMELRGRSIHRTAAAAAGATGRAADATRRLPVLHAAATTGAAGSPPVPAKSLEEYSFAPPATGSNAAAIAACGWLATR